MKERIKVGFAMLRLLLSLSLITLWLFASCKSKTAVLLDNGNVSNMELILQDDHSGAIYEEFFVIKNQKSLQSFFAKINKTRKPGLPVPDIDFDTDMLLVWCAGETTEATPHLEVQKETSESYIISKSNPKNTLKNSAVTSPFMVYKLPMSNKKITIQ